MLEGDTPILLDVRDPYELRAAPGHIDGVLNIPLALLDRRLDDLREHGGGDIVLICHSGRRSEMAADVLAQHGFVQVYILDGGMLAWKGTA